jgi:hypothetical protein
MSIQRWTVVDTYPDGGGAWVTYDDHVAAVAEEQAQRGVVYRTGLALGRAEALQDAREAVAAAPANQRRSNEDGAGGYIQHADGMGTSVNRSETFTEYLTRAAALAAIDALKGESNG